jgi:formylglycine-generating enzyme required for sulfatase activity
MDDGHGNYVNWDDAMELCRRLSEKEGKRYRLPSEAEWEYACRSGSTSAYSFSANPVQLREHAWFIENRATFFSQRSVRPVGSLKPNSFGLYDMYGNTKEWCSDWYGEYGDSAVTDPMGPLSGSQRVSRSSAIGSEASRCRSAARNATSPSSPHGLGVRLAMNPNVE